MNPTRSPNSAKCNPSAPPALCQPWAEFAETTDFEDAITDYVDKPILRHTGTGTTLPTTGDNALYFQ